jgi:hypothetical protein
MCPGLLSHVHPLPPPRRYLVDNPTLVRTHFARLGLLCSVQGSPGVWAPQDVPCTLTLRLAFPHQQHHAPSAVASEAAAGIAGLGLEGLEDELAWL